jgi:hypothetical protein
MRYRTTSWFNSEACNTDQNTRSDEINLHLIPRIDNTYLCIRSALDSIQGNVGLRRISYSSRTVKAHHNWVCVGKYLSKPDTFINTGKVLITLGLRVAAGEKVCDSRNEYASSHIGILSALIVCFSKEISMTEGSFLTFEDIHVA